MHDIQVSKKLNFKLKKTVWAFIVYGFCIASLIGQDVPYNSATFIVKALIYGLYPFLFIIVIYFIYFKKISKFNINYLKQRLHDEGKPKIIVKTIGFTLVIFIPPMLTFMFNNCLALSGEYAAKKEISELVLVKNVECDDSTRYSKWGRHRHSSNLVLTIINEKGRVLTIHFPYSICRRYPNIGSLKGETIKLKERSWALGKVYDSFSHSQIPSETSWSSTADLSLELLHIDWSANIPTLSFPHYEILTH